MYLREIANVIRSHVPSGKIPDGDSDTLFLLYAVLLRVKGVTVSRSDVHDAWSTWMMRQDEEHASLVPYEQLTDDVQVEDEIFAEAIRKASVDLQGVEPSDLQFLQTLFPQGPPQKNPSTPQLFELYKVIVQSSESLVGRRQGVNTFFLTMNGALLTASGLIVQNAGSLRLSGVGVFVLAATGALLCGAWRSLITSFGQLNAGKFKVINEMERHFSAAIYAAEWEALERGENPKVYRSFTSREIWVPNALLGLHGLTAIMAILIAAGLITFGTVSDSPAKSEALMDVTQNGSDAAIVAHEGLGKSEDSVDEYVQPPKEHLPFEGSTENPSAEPQKVD